MLPHLLVNCSDNLSSIKTIFDVKQIYISNVKITPEYIRYIRAINNTRETIQNNYIKSEIKIDNNIYRKRTNQYDYKEFCKIAINEKLINKNKIIYNNTPIISVIMPSYNKQDIL